jgi:hypothetical protein
MDPNYIQLARAMANLDTDANVGQILRQAGLVAVRTSWSDTGRSHFSSSGSNISDVRLNALVQERGRIVPIPQPIIRLPNFEDKTVDVNLNEIFIPVGNAWGADTFAVSLRDFIDGLPGFLSWRETITSGSLLADRDSQVLVSAQASVMPVPREGQADFVPSIYNYGSDSENPGVLVILVSNRGTSVTLVDNTRDKVFGGSGQMIFHNKKGEKTPFTVRSLRELVRTEDGRKTVAELENSGQKIGAQSGVNQMMMIQIPLVRPPLRRYLGLKTMSFGLQSKGMSFDGDHLTRGTGGTRSRGLDMGVVDVANYSLGKYIELNQLGFKIRRDASLPIRVDVMFYMVSDTVNLHDHEVAALPELLRRTYADGQNLGSLVTGDNYRRLTRNYRPSTLPWWKVVVVPHIPVLYRDRVEEYLIRQFGPYWMYRFASEADAERAVALFQP